MPQVCDKCRGSGSVPTRHEELVAKMGAEAAGIVEAGWDAIVSTGEVFTLRDGRRVAMPYRSLFKAIVPEGVEFNDCYAWAIGMLVTTGSLPEGAGKVVS